MAAKCRRLASLILAAAVVQGTAGCGEITTDAFSKWERMRDEQHARRLKNDAEMRTQMAEGAFGRDQLLPGGNIRSAASFGRPPQFPLNQTVMRLPSLAEVPVATLTTPAGVFEIRRADGAKGGATGGGIAGAGGGGGPCVYKPVMSTEDIVACR